MKDPAAVRELINSNVSLADLLKKTEGVLLHQALKPEQISCPFHGRDASKSARHYPETNSMYCFTCKKSWTPIGFWMDIQDMRFMAAAHDLAKRYRLDLSGVADIQKFSGKLNVTADQSGVDKRKMAYIIMESGVKALRGVEDPKTFGRMLFVLLSANKIEDEKRFAKVTMPLARKLKESLT